MMLRNGQLAPPPQQLADMTGIEIVFIGPLAKSQMSQDAVAIERALQTSMGLQQVSGRPSRVIDFDKAERVLYDRYNVPAEVIRSEDEVEEMIAAENEQAAKMAAQEDAMADAAIQGEQAQANTAQVELLQNLRGM